MNIQLEPFTADDISLFIDWISRDRIKQWYSPVEDWIDEVTKREAEYSWIQHYIIYADKTPIGFCQYYPYWKSGEDWNGNIPVKGTYSVDYLIGETEFLRKGYASKALRLLNSIICTLPDATRIIVQPDSDNLASCKTLLAAGYTYDEENHVYILSL